MRPGDFHAPGMPNKLPNQKPIIDKQGNTVIDGKTWTFQKCLADLLKHSSNTPRERGRGR